MKKNQTSLKWIFSNARIVVIPVLLLTLLGVSLSYISVKFALLSKQLLDVATGYDHSAPLRSKIISLALLVVLQLAIEIAYTLCNIKTEGELKNKLQRRLFQQLLYKDWSGVKKYHTGELLNRLNGDVTIVSNSVMSIVPTICTLIARIVFSFYALYRLDHQFALIFVVIGPFVMLIARLYSKRIKPLHKKCQECQGKTQSFLLESLQNILVIKSFKVHERITAIAHRLQSENLRVILKRGYLNIIANILFYISLTIGYYFAMAWCAYKISVGIMTVGTLTAILQLVGQVQSPFKELASTVPQFFAMTASAERVMELEAIPNEMVRYNHVDTKKIYNTMEAICAEHISFSYGQEKIFEDACIRIPKNTITAISGISGIGKSTFLKLIIGIITPNSGTIQIECKDQSYISDASLRPLFAYVPQGNMILSGTIRENIAFLNPHITEEKIIASAKLACIWNVIEEMPQGLDTILGEGGSGLSEGQIQRLAVARALCIDAPILLLDEATSALDEETERKMLENIRNLKNKTCIIISHKSCAMELSDICLTVENGKIKGASK